MERIIDVAQFIIEEYKNIANKAIDQMKLHKLLYFSQRESLAITNEPLFKENFKGWKYGPVSQEVRNNFTKQGMVCQTHSISLESAYIVKNIILQYGSYESWKLSEMTHKEYSWKNARKGLSKEAKGTRIISIDDIRKDAEKVRPYDSVYDMYYDEFEDAEDNRI